MEKKDKSFSLSLENIKKVPFDKYEHNFTFIVDGKRYETSRFVADIISPIIMNYHYHDETISEYTLNSNNQKEYFSYFLKLVNFESVELDDTLRNAFSDYFLQLGNINEYFRIQGNILENITPTNVVDYLLKIEKNLKSNKTIFKEADLSKIIDFCSEHFDEIPKENLKKLDVSMIEEIIRNDKLKLESEDILLKFLIDLYEQNHENSFLFEYVYFNQVEKETLSKFIDSFYFENMNNGIWKSICMRLIESNKKRNLKENVNEKIIEKQPNEKQPFDGLMKYLIDKTNGNIHDNKTIEITANSMMNNSIRYHPKNLVDYNSSNAYQANGKSAEITFDFKDKKIQITNYAIKTNGCRHLRNWIIEVSNDGKNWTKIDEHSNDCSLNNNNTIIFNVKQYNSYDRFVRLRETGTNSDSDYYTFFYNLEFFGKLKQI